MNERAPTLRERSASDNWALVRRWLPKFGISRVTEITALDQLALPVFAAVRPRGHVLCVHSGKGLSLVQARLGAALEALELAVAERTAPAVGCPRMSLRQWLANCPAGLTLMDFAPDPGALMQQDPAAVMTVVEWLGRRQPVLLPAALVHPIRHDDAGKTLFPWTSIGLATGNSVDEATLHALFEVLERDSATLNEAEDRSALLPASEWPEPYAEISRDWSRRGVYLTVRLLANDFGLPCFLACLHEPESPDVNLAEGTGLHLSAFEAFARAVDEAAQSRMNGIHGGRDDLVDFFGKYAETRAQRLQGEQRYLQALHDPTRTIAWKDVPDVRVRSIGEALREVQGRMRAHGLDWVFRSRLRVPGFEGLPVEVVKLVVPRSETNHPGAPRVGPRLAERILARGDS